MLLTTIIFLTGNGVIPTIVWAIIIFVTFKILKMKYLSFVTGKVYANKGLLKIAENRFLAQKEEERRERIQAIKAASFVRICEKYNLPEKYAKSEKNRRMAAAKIIPRRRNVNIETVGLEAAFINALNIK